MRLKLVYGIGIDLPAFEAGKLRYRELSRHRQHLRLLLLSPLLGCSTRAAWEQLEALPRAAGALNFFR